MSFSQQLSDENLGQNGKSSPVLIEVCEPQNHGVGSKKYTDYLVKTKVHCKSSLIIIFQLKLVHLSVINNYIDDAANIRSKRV